MCTFIHTEEEINEALELIKGDILSDHFTEKDAERAMDKAVHMAFTNPDTQHVTGSSLFRVLARDNGLNQAVSMLRDNLIRVGRGETPEYQQAAQ